MGAFWNSWQLWEKMSFVLALAIATTFCLGFIKVAWRNRFVRKQEMVEEEKRARLRELRRSGQFIEPRKSQDIPFGVRAIQSGIQVDGIWISGSNTPIPGSPGLPGSASSSAESSLRYSMGEPSQQVTGQSSSGGLSFTKQSDAGGYSSDRIMGHPTSDPFTPQSHSGHLSSYKPRRSSYLRFGSYGDPNFDEDTLAQLEGVTDPRSQNKFDGQGLSRQEGTEADSHSNVIDNGHSSDSDTSFHEAQELQPSHHPNRIPSIQSSAKFIMSAPHQAPLKAQFSNGDYAPVPNEDLGYERSSTSVPQDNIAVEVMTTTTEFRADVSRNPRPSTEVPLLSQAYAPLGQRETFVPGELHVNRASRRVNSGFEVLPAGTFGLPSEFRGSQEWHRDEDEGERRHSNKLQKKGRNSFSIRKPSLGHDRA